MAEEIDTNEKFEAFTEFVFEKLHAWAKDNKKRDKRVEEVEKRMASLEQKVEELPSEVKKHIEEELGPIKVEVASLAQDKIRNETQEANVSFIQAEPCAVDPKSDQPTKNQHQAMKSMEHLSKRQKKEHLPTEIEELSEDWQEKLEPFYQKSPNDKFPSLQKAFILYNLANESPDVTGKIRYIS